MVPTPSFNKQKNKPLVPKQDERFSFRGTTRVPLLAALSRDNGRTRRGLAGAHGRTKRVPCAGGSQPVTSVLCRGKRAIFPINAIFILNWNILIAHRAAEVKRFD